MSVWDSIEKTLAKVTYGDADVIGAEAITYAPFVLGRQQAAIPLSVVIDRNSPIMVIPEARGPRVRQIRFFLPNDPAGVDGSPSCNRGDVVAAPWKFGDSAENFRITEILNSDGGGWNVVAEASAN